jgi:hypothetical protein
VVRNEQRGLHLHPHGESLFLRRIDGDASTGGFTVTSITKEDAERYTIENGSRLS